MLGVDRGIGVVPSGSNSIETGLEGGCGLACVEGQNITGEPKPARYVPSAAIFGGNQDHIGLDVPHPVRSSLGDAHVSMSDLKNSLAQEECKG